LEDSILRHEAGQKLEGDDAKVAGPLIDLPQGLMSCIRFCRMARCNFGNSRNYHRFRVNGISIGAQLPE
jgi:hypothetical protein